MTGSWDDCSNLLCIRLDSLGDVLMTTPAIRALKQSAGGRRITLLSSASGVATAKYVPEIDEAIRYDAPWLKATAERQNSHIDQEFIREIRDRKFDGAVIFTVATQSALPAAMLCYLADIPLRLGHCRENPYQLLTDWLVDDEWKTGFRHEVQRQLDLVAAIGATTTNQRLSFEVFQQDKQSVRQLLKAHEIATDGAWVVVHPGATAPSRRYPIESFAQVADLLIDDGYQVVISGGADEIELVEQMQAAMNGAAHSLAGLINLGQMGALIDLAPVCITNNTGPAHMAAALGTPVVDLYALTNPQHHPWQVPSRVLFHDVPCKYCFKSTCPEQHHNCLRGVTPESVVKATHALIESLGGSRLDRLKSQFVEGLNDVHVGN